MAVVLVVILVVLVVTKKRGPQGVSSSFSSSLGFLFTRVQFASRWLVGFGVMKNGWDRVGGGVGFLVSAK